MITASDFYKQIIQPLREAKKPISDNQYSDLLTHVRPLIIHISRDFPMNEQERDEITTDTCTIIALRIHSGVLPINIGDYWSGYLRKVIHGLWVELVDARTKRLMDSEWLDDMKATILNKKESIWPDEICQNKESSQHYLKTVARVTEKIARGQKFALLGFYCYKYDLDLKVLPLAQIERDRVQLVVNTLEYYLNLKRPSWLTL